MSNAIKTFTVKSAEIDGCSWPRSTAALEQIGSVRRPVVPPELQHNAHMYYLLMPDLEIRTALIENLKSAEINAAFHHVPLHSLPAGQRYGRVFGDLSVTDSVSERLVRLPLWAGLTEADQTRVVEEIYRACNE